MTQPETAIAQPDSVGWTDGGDRRGSEKPMAFFVVEGGLILSYRGVSAEVFSVYSSKCSKSPI